MNNQSECGMFYNCDEIKTFKELFGHICYDWDWNGALQKDGDLFILNKTTIGKDFLSYKTECSPLAKGLYEKVEKLHELLEEK